MSHIFISYSKKDMAFAQYLRSLLQAEGFTVWIDERLVASERWWRTIEQNITTSAAFVLIMSPNSQESDWVEREILVAEGLKKPIFPILLDGKSWSRLANIQYEDMQAGLNATLDLEFITALKQFVPTYTGQPAPPPLPDKPATPITPAVQSTRRGSRAWIAGLLVVVLIVVVGIVMALNNRGNNPAATPGITASPEETIQVAAQPTETPAPSESPTSMPTETPSPTESPTLPPTETPIPLGFDGNPVTRNAEWQTYIEQYATEINGIEVVLVPAGCFSMGNDRFADDRAPGTPVPQANEQCFDNPFYISRYEMTNALFDELGCTAASTRKTGQQRPRENVSWVEAYNCAEHLKNQSGNSWHLPTEAEWEYAARGPDELFFPWGMDWNDTNLIWFSNSGDQTADIGADQRANGQSWVGAYDMSGNVMEWTSSICNDYPYDNEDGRENPDVGNNKPRCARGGSFFNYQSGNRATYRFQWAPNDALEGLGIRLAVSLPIVEDQ